MNRILVVAIALSLAAAACSDDPDVATTASESSPSAESTTTTEPPEPPSYAEQLAPLADVFENPANPTEADLSRLETLVLDIARNDPVIVGLVGDAFEPVDGVFPAYWENNGLFGGGFQVDIPAPDYAGPWPYSGCRGGIHYSETRVVEASDLSRMSVSVDVLHGTVRGISSLPPEVGTTSVQPTITTVGPSEPQPSFVGSCNPTGS